MARRSCGSSPLLRRHGERFALPSVQSPDIGEQLTLALNIAEGENVGGYQATVQFDPTALRYVESANGDYLPAGAFAVPAVVTQNAVTLAATALAGVSNGDGTLAALTFEVVAVKASTLTLSDVILSDSAGVGSRPHVENGQVIEAALTPKETALLPNYPNPFNPETWLPYHLAHAADVTLTVYDTKGAVVRQLVLGHQPAGFYTARAKAAYWNGRNESGESVASGLYFYQLRAGD